MVRAGVALEGGQCWTGQVEVGVAAGRERLSGQNGSASGVKSPFCPPTHSETEVLLVNSPGEATGLHSGISW